MRDRIVQWAGPLLAAVVLCAGPGWAGARPRNAEASVEAKAPAKAESKSAPTAPAPIIAKGRLFAVVLGPGAAWKKGQPFKGPGLDAHRLYWKGLYAEGRVASAGPLGDRSGLALIRAKNQKEADALLAADPAVKAKVLAEVARPYSADLTSAPVLVGK
ncbi:MAG: YciI family protein [Novosphingobium sp.]